MQNNKLSAVLACSALLSASAPAAALDAHGYSIEAAKGSESRMFRLGLQRNIDRTWLRSERYHLGAFWDLTLAAWRGDAYRGQQGERQTLWDIGLTPTVRYQRHDRRGWYAEAGIGAHYLSGLWNNGSKELSTRFQFGDHIGTGYVFRNGLDLALKFQHHSNGGIKNPNDGANFVILKAGFPF
jgi:lipid A 3-O-deacylase